MSTRLAIFDLDGTLFNGRVWQAFIRHHFSHKIHRREAAGYLLRNFSQFFLYKVGLRPRDAVWDRFAREIPTMLRGMDEAAAEAALRRIFEQSIRPALDPLLLEKWDAFGRKGFKRFIISGSPEPMLALIGKHLGATAAFGTVPERRAGRFTGDIVGALCQNEEKAQRLQRYVAEQGWQVAWSDSHSFADSYSDLPILELVGHPVVVRPDPRLHAHALGVGWPVLGDPASS